ALAAGGVVQRPLRQVEGQGVDRKIAPQQVVFQLPRGDGWQRAWPAILFLARRGDVDLRQVVRRDFVREELREGAHPAVDGLGQGTRQCRRAILQREVDVDDLP